MRLFLFLLLLFISSHASSHEIRPAFLQIVEIDSGQQQLFEASFRQPQINGRYLGLQLQTNCEAITTSASLTNGALIESIELNCGEVELETISINGLERTLIDTLVSIQSENGDVQEMLINGKKPSIQLSEATPSIPVYLTIGVEHLLFGFDHVLFLIMLLYIVYRPIQILIVVTSFTVAHSLTLVLSAFDIITLSAAPVEAIIAGSIVLLAFENLNDKPTLTKQYPAIIAFGFGLLHGLGFAGALAEIGLPENSQLLALFLFNVGIEVGQLSIIAVVLGFLAIARVRYQQVLYQLPLFLTGGVASYWFIERSWQILM